jgi:hypothetical protein
MSLAASAMTSVWRGSRPLKARLYAAASSLPKASASSSVGLSMTSLLDVACFAAGSSRALPYQPRPRAIDYSFHAEEAPRQPTRQPAALSGLPHARFHRASAT